MAENFANDFTALLNGAIDNSVTSVAFDNAAGTQPAIQFRILVQDSESDDTNREYMLVTAGTSTPWTVTRGIEGSTAVAHADNSFIAHVVTAGSLVQAIVDRTGPNYHPDRYPTSGLNAVSDEFDDSSLNAAWTWTTAPSGTVSESQFPGYLHIDGGTNATPSERFLRRAYAPGATDFSVATKVVMSIDNGNYSSLAGIALLDASDVVIWQIFMSTDGSATASDNHRIGGTNGSLTGGNVLNQPVYLLITRSSANVYNGYFSRDGIVWQRIGGSTVATTVAKVAIDYQSDTDSVHEEAAWDFVRVFDSITRKIGA